MSAGLGYLGQLPIEIRSHIYQFVGYGEVLMLEKTSDELKEELYVIKCQNASQLWRKLQVWGKPFFELLKENMHRMPRRGKKWWSRFIEKIKDIPFEKRKTQVVDEQGVVSYREENDLVIPSMNHWSGKERNIDTLIEIVNRIMMPLRGPSFSDEDTIGRRKDINSDRMFEEMIKPSAPARRSISESRANPDFRLTPCFLISPSNQARAFLGEMAYSIVTTHKGKKIVKQTLKQLLNQDKWNPGEEGFVIGCLASLAKKDLCRVLEYIEKIPHKEKVILELADIFRRYEEHVLCNRKQNEEPIGFLELFLSTIDFKKREIKTQLELVKILSKYAPINALTWAKEIENEEIRNQAIVEILYHIPVFIRAGGIEGVQELLKLAERIPEKLMKNKRGLKTIVKYLQEVMRQAPQNIFNLLGPEGEREGWDPLGRFFEYDVGIWRAFALIQLIEEYTKIAQVMESDREILELLLQIKPLFHLKYNIEDGIPGNWISLTNYAFHVREERAFLEVLERTFSEVLASLLYLWNSPHVPDVLKLLKLWVTRLAESPFKDSSPCILWLVDKLSEFYRRNGPQYQYLYRKRIRNEEDKDDRRLSLLNEVFIEFMKHFGAALKEKAIAHKFSELIRNMEMVISLPSLEEEKEVTGEKS